MSQLRLVLVLLLALAGCASTNGRSLDTPVAIAVDTGDRLIPVHVAIASTAREQARGLMFVKALADDQGMLFVYDQAQRQTFWMKNTPLSLDILFFDNDRRLVSMHTATVPGSLQRLPSGSPARYVLEMKAGFAARHGIVPGDYLILEPGTKKGE